MALHFDVEQNTEAWLELRKGIPTASSFHKIITPKKGELSKQANEYADYLAAETLVGHVIDFESKWMERGHELEAEAVSSFELQTGLDTHKAGFWMDDEKKYGASPDRLVGDDALLEIKCPKAHNHVSAMRTLAIDKDYYPQCQGQLLVTGRIRLYIVSYYPELPPVQITVERDEKYIAKLKGALETFTKHLDALKAELRIKYPLI